MQGMMDFSLWFLSQLPDFLLSEPINAFVGLAVLFSVGSLFRRIIHMR